MVFLLIRSNNLPSTACGRGAGGEGASQLALFPASRLTNLKTNGFSPSFAAITSPLPLAGEGPGVRVLHTSRSFLLPALPISKSMVFPIISQYYSCNI
jgi:hypothetical protein